MTEQIYTDWATESPRSGTRSLWRLVIWGTLAGVSLFIAIISAYSGHRATAAVASSYLVGSQAGDQETAQQRAALADLRAQSMSNAEETRRLSEAVRTLAADRDQLASRVAGLERGYDNVTGSVKRPGAPLAAQANQPAINAAPAGRAEAPMTSGSTTGAASANSAASGSAAPTSAASALQATMAAAQPGMPSGHGEEAKSTEAAKGTADAAHSPAAEPLPPSGLGVDVGGAPNFEGLRSLWHTTKNNDPSLLDDFYPVVATRENSKTRGRAQIDHRTDARRRSRRAALRDARGRAPILPAGRLRGPTSCRRRLRQGHGRLPPPSRPGDPTGRRPEGCPRLSDRKVTG